MIVNLKDYFLIGEIKAVFDEDGFVSIGSFSDFDDRFIDLEYVYAKIYGVVKKLFINNVDRSTNNILIQFRNFDSAAYAEPLVGLRIYVEEKSAVRLDDDKHFIHDLIGCRLEFNGIIQGRLTDIYILKTNDVYVIERPNGEEILIPGIDEFVDSIDVKSKLIQLKHDVESIFLDED